MPSRGETYRPEAAGRLPSQDQGTFPLVERQEGPLPDTTAKIKGPILAFNVSKGPFLTTPTTSSLVRRRRGRDPLTSVASAHRPPGVPSAPPATGVPAAPWG